MTFRPAQDYEGLLVQARALDMACTSKAKRVAYWREACAQLTQQIALQNSESVQAERATNEILTGALEKAEDEIERLVSRVADLQEELQYVLSDWNAVVSASGSRSGGAMVGHVTAMRAELERLRR